MYTTLPSPSLCATLPFFSSGADIVSVDYTVSMDDALKRLRSVKPDIRVQGNLDPAVLLSSSNEQIKVTMRGGGGGG